jgi:nicotinate-nucleotide adenylyltransferase
MRGKIIVFGGTFDPVHNGHMAVAAAVFYACKPQRILFMPAAHNPHKQDSPTPSKHRYRMLLAATATHPAYEVSDIEISRKGGASYTIDTLDELKRHYTDISFVIGADQLGGLAKWRDAPRLLRESGFIAVPRPGYTLDTANLHENIQILPEPYINISATEIRAALRSGKPTHEIPPAVAEYARMHGLYAPAPGFAAVQADLQRILSEKRYRHTMGVIIEAEKLAAHYGESIEKARWAALLHDCAKEYPRDKMLAACAAYGIEVDEFFAQSPNIAHARVGAEVARRHYGCTCDATLRAIRYHNTGHPQMTMLDKIIRLSDYIEQYRDECPVRDKMRRVAYTDINRALYLGMKFTKKQIKQRGWTLHPLQEATTKMLKKLVKEEREEK